MPIRKGRCIMGRQACYDTIMALLCASLRLSETRNSADSAQPICKPSWRSFWFQENLHCADRLCRWVVQTDCADGLCRWIEQIGRADGSCRWVVQMGCADGLCRWVMQIGRADRLCIDYTRVHLVWWCAEEGGRRFLYSLW